MTHEWERIGPWVRQCTVCGTTEKQEPGHRPLYRRSGQSWTLEPLACSGRRQLRRYAPHRRRIRTDCELPRPDPRREQERDCQHYQDCLTTAARTRATHVPCSGCPRHAAVDRVPDVLRSSGGWVADYGRVFGTPGWNKSTIPSGPVDVGDE